ncbi:MAG: hypothetical protein HYW27_02890 [Candidatus Aenigmarchaeota archaeon]|nr:hypothetical protein [Candidatus Aenigmarchaeota archaeon]
MAMFKVYGRGVERVDRARRVLGRACFLSGLDVVDFTTRTLEPNNYNIAYVKADKVVRSRLPEPCDYLVLLDEKVPAKAFDGLRDGCVIFSNSEEKVSPKNVKTKCHAIKSAIPEMALLGALTKIFPKVSMKSMNSAIDMELGGEKILHSAFEEGYKGVK